MFLAILLNARVKQHDMPIIRVLIKKNPSSFIDIDQRQNIAVPFIQSLPVFLNELKTD